MKDGKKANSSISRGPKIHEPTSPSSADTRERSTPHAFPEQPDFEAARSWMRNGLDERHYSQLAILDLLMRSHHVSGQIEEEFAGQPFWPDKAPDGPENVRRFKTYIAYRIQAGQLLELAIQLAMTLDGWGKTTDSEPRKSRGGKNGS